MAIMRNEREKTAMGFIAMIERMNQSYE